ncbi:Na/Pi-cotransporter [Thermanaerovibrio velox DSM 12556]|uniref:Na/Pi-cotransporter n=1 Tax=Thermanaerovibrio velox DSM 12556 TaxID=926567 RepID=H0UNN2_9BACT|nr:Na/Pi cotransporter family protein [Thermanaerovibrio velox]EHM10447.1 Na/Pi-cotransporter [Thermanaerovibrio velox DSM 12556]
MSFKVLLQLLGGVGMLIYGIKVMGDSLQNLAGDRLRRLIAKLTGTPIKGVIVGTAVTTIIQSSSATTVMVVSFVHAGLMTLYQAFGVIMGANIGTTVTAQIMAFKITDIAYLCVLIGAFLFLMSKTKRQREIGAGLAGFGILFIGMHIMGDSMSFLKGRDDLFMPFRHHPIWAVFAGTAVTMVIQSSSATVGLTMAMASQGFMPLNVAIAFILGDNIGTTITAVLASLGGNRSAKQAAACHVMFNVLGTLIMLPLLPWYSKLIALTASDISRQVANAHTFFNVANTLIFLPFVKPYVNLIRRIVPDDGVVKVYGPAFLDRNLISASPAAALDALKKEMVRMGYFAKSMLEGCRGAIVKWSDSSAADVLNTEKIVNELTHEIVRYGTELGQKGLSSDLSFLLNSCINGVGDIERMGDHSTNLVEMYQYMRDHNLKFTESAMKEFEEMFSLVYEAVSKSIEALDKEDLCLAGEVMELEDRVDEMEKRLRARHIDRLNHGKCSPGAGVVFIDILSNLERVGDHAHNLACVVMDMAKVRGQEVCEA